MSFHESQNMYGSGSVPSVDPGVGAIELRLSPRLKLRLRFNPNLKFLEKRFLRKGSLENLLTYFCRIIPGLLEIL